MSVNAIVTIPPYAPYIGEVAKHPFVSGVRINTVMPIKEPLEEMLNRIKGEVGDKDVWLDLKARQIRVTNFASSPYQHLEISHNIKVDTPVTAYFSDGEEEATIARVDGKRIIMLDGPKRVVGPGESINIPDESLSIEGFLTDKDKEYVAAAKKVGIHTYMLSYVEEKSDVTDFLKRDPDAQILAKIESRKGLDFAKNVYSGFGDNVNLMTARGDLYVEVKRPHLIVNAVKTIAAKDSNAVLASRLFPSLRSNRVPCAQDISDASYMLDIGYKRFMIGDDICFNRESLLSALNILDAIVKDHRPLDYYKAQN
jgi:hypothetical protein